MSHSPAPETQVNTDPASLQFGQQITALADGGWVISWTAFGQDGSGSAVCQQAYNADGTTRGVETRVNTHVTGPQVAPQITALSGGGWVVTWTSSSQDGDGYGVYQQAYNANGTTRGSETRVNTFTDHDQFAPQITALTDGGWVVTWQSVGQDGPDAGIYLQAYDTNGNALGETRVNTEAANDQTAPKITALADGGWVVTWMSADQDGSGEGIYQQAYDADGNPIAAGETHVNTHTSGDQFNPKITALADGGWVVAWSSVGQDGDGYGIYQQAYDANGAAIGIETQVNTVTVGIQYAQQVTALADGGWVVSWVSVGQDGSNEGVYQQAYDAQGNAFAVGETQVNFYAVGHQNSQRITALADGGWVVTWTSGAQDGDSRGVFQRVYDADGTARGDEIQVNTYTAGDQYDPQITALTDGAWVVTWTSWGQDGDGDGVYQQRFDALGQIYGTNHAPTASDATLTALEDTAYTFSTSDFDFSDGSDGDSLSAVIISTLPTSGTLTLDGVAVAAGDAIDASDIAAGKLLYVPSIDAHGDGVASLAFKVVDDGGTASGGFDTSGSHTLTFDVTVVNDAPTAADNTVSLLEDGSYTFATSAFGFADYEVESDSLSAVIITTLPTSGTLTLDGVAVATGDAIDAGDIAAGELVYMPPADANGDGLASFTFQVVDDGGIDNGGTDTSGTYTITFDVVPVPAVETQVNTHTTDSQYNAQVSALGDGGWVVTWTSYDQDGDGYGIYQQAYNADGTTQGDETRVNSGTANWQYDQRTAALDDGGWVVTWTSLGQDGSSSGVYQQAYNADGIPVGGETPVHTYTGTPRFAQQIAALDDGGWVVTWTSDDQDGSGDGIYQQAHNADGTTRGGETRVNSHTTDEQHDPYVTALAGGGWVVTWTSEGQDGSVSGVYQQAYHAGGTAGRRDTGQYLYEHLAGRPAGRRARRWRLGGRLDLTRAGRRRLEHLPAGLQCRRHTDGRGDPGQHIHDRRSDLP